MEIPKFDEFYNHTLLALKDGEILSGHDIDERVRVISKISEEDAGRLLPSGARPMFIDRTSWARTYLKKAGLIESPKRGHFKIMDEGLRVLRLGIYITTKYLSENYEEFYKFKYGNKGKKETEGEVLNSTPEELIEKAYKSINDSLGDDLLEIIMSESPEFFEKLVVDLMEVMGYGKGFVTKYSKDTGIDGIINEDKLGFSKIYIQAKRWGKDNVVGRPEVQKFAGAMMGIPKMSKGLFITTSRFTDDAKSFADSQHIILIDGKRLTELMIEYNIGVHIQNTYKIKRIDRDYFEN